MTTPEIENLLIRSLDAPLTAAEQTLLSRGLSEDASLAKQLADYKRMRALLKRTDSASFGYSFTAKLLARIENTGVIIERQIFTFFRKYQLLAAGVIAALLILNIIFSEQLTLDSIFGWQSDSPSDDEIISFDFNEILNNDL